MNHIIITIITSIGSLGILAGGMGYLINTFRKGSKIEKTEVMTTSQEVINFWKSQAENYQTILDKKESEWNTKFQELTRQIGEIQGQLSAEKAQNERLEKIFQNRDPDHQKFMESVMKALSNQEVVNKEIVRVLSEIHGMALKGNKVENTITNIT